MKRFLLLALLILGGLIGCAHVNYTPEPVAWRMAGIVYRTDTEPDYVLTVEKHNDFAAARYRWYVGGQLEDEIEIASADSGYVCWRWSRAWQTSQRKTIDCGEAARLIAARFALLKNAVPSNAPSRPQEPRLHIRDGCYG